MKRSIKSDESGRALSTDVLAVGERASPRALQPTTEKLEDAASTFGEERDEASFTVLYLATQQRMTSIVRRRCVLAADVEDVVSIAGAAVWFSRELFEGQTYAAFVAYAAGITRHKALDWLDQQDRDKRIPIVRRGLRVPFEDLAADRTPSPEDVAALHEAFSKLEPRQQTALRMYCEGWSFREIGEVIGCDKNAARVIYLDTVERMRRMLA